jgi:hypothetical protein
MALLSLSARAHADEPDRAEELFREGNSAFAAGDFRTAYVAYREAWTLRRSFDIACNLGRTEAELMLSRDAAEHLDYCLRTFSVSSRSEMKDAYKRFRDLFTKVRSEVAALRIEARPPGTEITVDGARYGVAPLGRDVFVDPGQHRVVGRFAGFSDAQRIVQVEAGGTLSVNLTLTQATPATPTAPAAPTPTAPPMTRLPQRTPANAKARTIVVASGAALSLAGMGIGLGFLLKADSAADRVDELNATLQSRGNACSAGSMSSSCSALRTDIDSEKRSRDIASAAFTAGAVASLATLGAWLLIPDSRPDRTSGVRATPYVSAEQAGLSFSGTY